MAMDMFVKIGAIKGESKDASHKEECDVLAWSWGMSQSGSAHTGGGQGAGKVNVQDLSVTKYIDKSSADVMLACCKGTHSPEIKLTVRKAGDKPLEYVIITMTDCLVASVSTGGSGGEDMLTENVTFNFAKFKVFYEEQTKSGSGGAKPEFEWSIEENQKTG